MASVIRDVIIHILENILLSNRQFDFVCGRSGQLELPPFSNASGTGQLQANPPVVTPRLRLGKPTQRIVTTMGSNDLIIGIDHFLGSSFHRYNLQTGS